MLGLVRLVRLMKPVIKTLFANRRHQCTISNTCGVIWEFSFRVFYGQKNDSSY